MTYCGDGGRSRTMALWGRLRQRRFPASFKDVFTCVCLNRFHIELLYPRSLRFWSLGMSWRRSSIWRLNFSLFTIFNADLQRDEKNKTSLHVLVNTPSMQPVKEFVDICVPDSVNSVLKYMFVCKLYYSIIVLLTSI